MQTIQVHVSMPYKTTYEICSRIYSPSSEQKQSRFSSEQASLNSDGLTNSESYGSAATAYLGLSGSMQTFALKTSKKREMCFFTCMQRRNSG